MQLQITLSYDSILLPRNYRRDALFLYYELTSVVKGFSMGNLFFSKSIKKGILKKPSGNLLKMAILMRIKNCQHGYNIPHQ